MGIAERLRGGKAFKTGLITVKFKGKSLASLGSKSREALPPKTFPTVKITQPAARFTVCPFPLISTTFYSPEIL